MTSTHETCNSLRNCNVRHHDDLMTLVAVFADTIKQSQVLSDDALKFVLDMLDNEIVGMVEQDQIDQQQEQTWHERQQMPHTSGVRAELDALTIYQAAT